MIANDNYQVRYQQLKTKASILYKEITMVLVLKGKLVITIEEEVNQLSSGELFVVNAGDTADLTSDLERTCSYLTVTINSLYFATQFPAFFNTRFACTPKQKEHGKMQAITLLRKQLAELCLVEFNEDPSKQIKITLFLAQIILSLVHHFQKEKLQEYHLSDNQKLREILEYIELHYQEGLLLSDLAEHFFMSESSLSKFFKKETGEYFSHYVRTISVKHSLTALLHTKKSIEQIALDCGFSNSKTYRQHFKKIFNESPTIYRAAHLTSTSEPLKNQELNPTTELSIKGILALLYSFIQTPSEEQRPSELSSKTSQLSISAEYSEDEYQKKELIIHVGSWECLASKKVQTEILELKKQIGIKYISVHSLFTHMPLSFKIYEQAKMNSFPAFEEWDYILAFLMEAQLDVFYQLSLVAYRAMGKDIKDLTQKFFSCVQNKYGTIITSRWKVNCLFEEENPEDYYAEFFEIKKILAAISPKIKIGAKIPLSDPFFEKNKSKQIHYFCETIAPECDFLSYTAEPNYVFQNVDSTFPDLKKYHQYVLTKTVHVKQLLKSYELKLPLYLMEWNTLTGMTRNSNGTFFRGAIVLKDLLKLATLVDGFGFWLNIELYEQNTQKRPLKNDGLELFHYYSGKRPVYFCLWLARRMKGTILSQGEEYLLTYEAGNYQLLLFNTNYFDPHLSSEEAFLKSQAVAFELELIGIASEHYQVKQIDFNRHSGALFYMYEEFRSAKTLDLETQEYIVEQTRPKIKVFDTEIIGAFNYYVNLDTNGIILLELTPVFKY